jgi:hypothetical protein
LKNYRPWFISFLNVFVSMYFFLTLFQIFIYALSGRNTGSYISFIFSISYAAFAASRYISINTKIPIRNKGHLLDDLQSILSENGWKIKKSNSKKIELKIPASDRFLFSKLEIRLFDDFIELDGYKKYVDKLTSVLRILS